MLELEPERTFQNPVFKRSFPDPFVFKFRGEFFAFATGYADDGLCFPRLRSRDLVHWEELPGAMPPLNTGEPYYWAPEVTYLDGKFYLYYSVGNETLMTIRVAVSNTPDGEFLDAGKELTSQDFAIDPHVFRDTDGRIFMFYATDFVDHSHIGTGTVADAMIDPFTLRGEPLPVARAQFDWQVYDPARKEKGGVRWHTVEGPCVLKRKGIYYEMFSGGNWQNTSYGVSFAVSDDIEDENEWSQYSDGLRTAPILKTLPGRVIGPGHNSVVAGPNNRELYCVYHRWEGDKRVMAIDRMDFAGGGNLFVIGPSFDPQPAPYKPQLVDDFAELDPNKWRIRKGEWRVANGELISSGDAAEIVTSVQKKSFLCKVFGRLTDISGSAAGIRLFSANGSHTFALRSEAGRNFAHWKSGVSSEEYALRSGFDLTAFHELSVEVDERWLRITVDGGELTVERQLLSSISEIGLFSENQSTAFSGFTVTHGFEELFETNDLDIRGWTTGEKKHFAIENGILFVIGDEDGSGRLEKELLCENLELAVNLKFVINETGYAALTLSCGNSFVISPSPRWQIEAGDTCFALPESLASDDWLQLRFVARDSEISIWVNDFFLGTVKKIHSEGLSFLVRNAAVCIDMIRVTKI